MGRAKYVHTQHYYVTQTSETSGQALLDTELFIRTQVTGFKRFSQQINNKDLYPPRNVPSGSTRQPVSVYRIRRISSLVRACQLTKLSAPNLLGPDYDNTD